MTVIFAHSDVSLWFQTLSLETSYSSHYCSTLLNNLRLIYLCCLSPLASLEKKKKIDVRILSIDEDIPDSSQHCDSFVILIKIY